MGTLRAKDCALEAISVGEAKLNEGIVAEEMEESIARMGHTLYTSKYPGCREVADWGEVMVGMLGVGEYTVGSVWESNSSQADTLDNVSSAAEYGEMS